MSDELNNIREQADAMGISYHHRASVSTIQKLIDAHNEQAGYEKEDAELQVAQPQPKKEKIVPMTAEEFRKKNWNFSRTRVGTLIRCRIQCMNPAKKDWPGEIISVGSAKLGTFKKYIPFNGEPYHVPKIIYDVLDEKQCSVYYNAIDDRGRKVRKSRQIKEYAMEILPSLTKQELSDLARKQAMAAGQGLIN